MLKRNQHELAQFPELKREEMVSDTRHQSVASVKQTTTSFAPIDIVESAYSSSVEPFQQHCFVADA